MLARYQHQFAAIVGRYGYRLMLPFDQLPVEDPDRRRVETVCELAVEYRRLTGRSITSPLDRRR
ncbi:MAG: hypothetical protein JO342_15555 [Solirubrobacterales bacterium]|nr:hypothetical protein [Solirubrobacterales bacterium]